MDGSIVLTVLRDHLLHQAPFKVGIISVISEKKETNSFNYSVVLLHIKLEWPSTHILTFLYFEFQVAIFAVHSFLESLVV